jgi:GNAT superfamily N-acetyltransferase
MLRIVRGGREDIGRLVAFDPMAQQDEERRSLLKEWLAAGAVHLALVDGGIAGFAVLTRSFFREQFIELVFVGEGHRRRGIGFALVTHCVAIAPAQKTWTSTNASNRPMQALLAKAGFILSGRVDNLDPGDPELIYVRLPRVTPVESAAT